MITGAEKTQEVIDEALSAGYRLFDTAHLYRNERNLGEAFKVLLPKHNLTRNDIFITTKFGKCFKLNGAINLTLTSPKVPSTAYKTEADYEKLVRESLRNLQTDYIDMFLIHWPGAY